MCVLLWLILIRYDAYTHTYTPGTPAHTTSFLSYTCNHYYVHLKQTCTQLDQHSPSPPPARPFQTQHSSPNTHTHTNTSPKVPTHLQKVMHHHRSRETANNWHKHKIALTEYPLTPLSVQRRAVFTWSPPCYDFPSIPDWRGEAVRIQVLTQGMAEAWHSRETAENRAEGRRRLLVPSRRPACLFLASDSVHETFLGFPFHFLNLFHFLLILQVIVSCPTK